MPISRKINDFLPQASLIRKMADKATSLKQIHGKENVFDFSIGNPCLDPPEIFKTILKEICEEEIPNKHGYVPNAGIKETRSAVAKYLSTVHDKYLSEEHVIMTVGAGGALNVALKSILNPGDEVLIFSPYFSEYKFYVDNHGGKIIDIPTKNDFSLDLERIDNAINENTRAVIINSPNNPTGHIYDQKSVDDLSYILNNKQKIYRRHIYMISDEPYREIVFDGFKVPSVFKSYVNSIIATSYSKSISIPGERIGLLALNPEMEHSNTFMQAASFCNRILGFSSAPALMQRVVGRMQGQFAHLEAYNRKRDLLCDGLSACGYSFEKPNGAFYVFPRTPIEDDIAFVNELVKENIVTVPGSGFGTSGHFRISFCVPDETINLAMKGFETTIRPYI